MKSLPIGGGASGCGLPGETEAQCRTVGGRTQIAAWDGQQLDATWDTTRALDDETHVS